MMKSRSTSWAVFATRTEEMRHRYRLFMGKPEAYREN